MDDSPFCHYCGSSLPPGAQFCPKCGKGVSERADLDDTLEVVPSPPVPPPPVPPAAAQQQEAPRSHAVPQPQQPPSAPPPPPRPQKRRGTLAWAWVLVPLILIVLAILAWLILANFPLDERRARERTIRESAVAERDGGTTTISELGTTAPGDSIVVEQEEANDSPRREGEISEAEALDTLRFYMTRNDSYDVADRCLSLRSQGYKNRGYTFEVHDSCRGNRLLGRWRVDTKTGEVYRQRADGRYLSP
jgi:hypothetical protein